MPEAAVVEFVIQRTTRHGKPFVRRCVVVDVRLEYIEPMGYGLLLTSLAEMQRLGDTA
jgi:hypothetical protein